MVTLHVREKMSGLFRSWSPVQGLPNESNNIMLVGCGGVQVAPKCTHQLKMRVYEYEVSVPMLVVTGQRDKFLTFLNLSWARLSRTPHTGVW